MGGFGPQVLPRFVRDANRFEHWGIRHESLTGLALTVNINNEARFPFRARERIMIRLSPHRLLVAAAMSAGLSAYAQEPLTALPDGAGKELVEAACVACHETGEIREWLTPNGHRP